MKSDTVDEVKSAGPLISFVIILFLTMGKYFSTERSFIECLGSGAALYYGGLLLIACLEHFGKWHEESVNKKAINRALKAFPEIDISGLGYISIEETRCGYKASSAQYPHKYFDGYTRVDAIKTLISHHLFAMEYAIRNERSSYSSDEPETFLDWIALYQNIRKHIFDYHRRLYRYPNSIQSCTEKLHAIIHKCDALGEIGYWAEVPALPGCFAEGRTIEAVKINVKEAVRQWGYSVNFIISVPKQIEDWVREDWNASKKLDIDSFVVEDCQ